MSKIAIILIVIVITAVLVMRFSGDSKAAAENIKIGEDFLAKNALEEGVESTPSGLQYKVLTKGNGSEHPSTSNKVKVHYHGTLIDGTVFDSSVERGQPISFGVTQVIPGWVEGLQLMVVGDKTRFFIPSNLAYGNRATGKISAGSMLIFDVELIEIQ